jgi:hypothetical protein
MRRLLALVSTLCMLVSVAGCHDIIVGICDCSIPGHQCCYGPCAYHMLEPAYLTQPAPVMVSPAAAEPAKMLPLPKEASKEPPVENK